MIIKINYFLNFGSLILFKISVCKSSTLYNTQQYFILKLIERCGVFIYMIDVLSDDYQILFFLIGIQISTFQDTR